MCAERTPGRTCQVRGWALTQSWALGSPLGREEVNQPFCSCKKVSHRDTPGARLGCWPEALWSAAVSRLASPWSGPQPLTAESRWVGCRLHAPGADFSTTNSATERPKSQRSPALSRANVHLSPEKGPGSSAGLSSGGALPDQQLQLSDLGPETEQGLRLSSRPRLRFSV